MVECEWQQLEMLLQISENQVPCIHFFSDRYIVDILDPFFRPALFFFSLITRSISENSNPDHRQDSKTAQNSTRF